jgi:hypothetical protein
MHLPQRLGHGIDPSPLPLPVEVPRAFQLTDPVFTSALNTTTQFQDQDPVVKGIVSLGKMAFLFELLDDVRREFCPFLRVQTMHAVMQQLQYTPACFLHLGIVRAHGFV